MSFAATLLQPNLFFFALTHFFPFTVTNKFQVVFYIVTIKLNLNQGEQLEVETNAT